MSLSESLTLPMRYHYDLEPSGSGPALICLHGYGQSKAEALRFGRGVAPAGPVAALQAPHPHHRVEEGRIVGTGFGWVSAFAPEDDVANHHRFVLGVLERLHELGAAPEGRAFLFGFSQSVSLNYRCALAHPERLWGVIAVAGAVPSDWLSERDKPPLRVPVLHISATGDRAYPPERAAAFRAELEARCTDLTWHDLPGGHRVPRAAYPLMRAWVARVWEGER